MPLRITVTGNTNDAVRAMCLIGLLLQLDNDSVQVEQRPMATVSCITASAEVPDPMPLPDLAQRAANGHPPAGALGQIDEATAEGRNRH